MATRSRWSEIPHQPYELYQAWEAARQEAQLAYADWCNSHGDRAEAYLVYRAAADREDAAAEAWMCHDATSRLGHSSLDSLEAALKSADDHPSAPPRRSHH